MNINFKQRIGYNGDISMILSQVCKDYDIGKYISYTVILIGYEDYNLILKTDKGDYFVKIFASFRDIKESKRYVDIMLKVIEMNVAHPKLYKSKTGFLYEQKIDNVVIRLCVMEYINGKSFFQLGSGLNLEEKLFIIHQAAMINKIKIRPRFVYDSWAITSFLDEYKEKGRFLSQEDQKLIRPYVKKFSFIMINKLPHCFVHGDITKTNTMKDNKGNIYIIDFAVANYYPRIQELAVLLCDQFFDEKKPENFLYIYDFVLKEYQIYIRLTPFEIKILPIYLQFAHAMHLLRANYEKVVNKNNTDENIYFLTIGRAGLQLTTNLWRM